MKKSTALTCGALLFTVTIFVLLVAMLFPVLFPKTDNVFDRLYYEVKRSGKDSVLLSGTESAYADYDLGSFQHISIPDLGAALSIHEDSLNLSFYHITNLDTGEYFRSVHYRYDHKDKKLYGEQDLIFLNQFFLSHYFGWLNAAGEACKFSLENPGEFEFIRQDTVHYFSN